jgi:hypothetical protein
MTTPRSVAWRFGPDWPGRRCGAKTRRGTPCQKPSLRGNSRCQLHGARGGAPSGMANGNYKSGRYTKESLARSRETLAELRRLYRLGKSIGMFG